jgi:CelD/BcsL family acetyltransferase involved in cellulose biosynthesis
MSRKNHAARRNNSEGSGINYRQTAERRWSMSAQLEISEIDSQQALEALGPEWRALWERIGDSTPFQSPEWLIPWWQFLGRR